MDTTSLSSLRQELQNDELLKDDAEEHVECEGESARLLAGMPCFQPLRQDHFELAPCEGMVPVGIFSETHLEEMCFPDLFNGVAFEPVNHGSCHKKSTH